MGLYLVTGAAGFIGAALSKKLVSDGHQVVTIDNLSTGMRENIPKGVEFIQGDCQSERTVALLDRYPFDTIFHIAGQSSGEISFENPVYDLQTNAQSTLLLLQHAKKIGCKKFIYASTMSVYGEQPDEPVKETAGLFPKSFYGVGKLASENYLRIYGELGINSTALRLFNVYGPGQNMENMKQGMVSIFLSYAIKQKHINVKGGPDRFRDFIYIDDVVDAFLSTAGNHSNGYYVFNVGTGVKTSVSQLIAAIQRNLPFDVSVEYGSSTPGDQFGIVSDSSLLNQSVGWMAKVSLNDGIKKMAGWALMQLS